MAQNSSINEKEEIIVSVNDHWVVYIRPAIFLILGWSIFALIHTIIAQSAIASEYRIAASLFAFFSLVVAHHFFFILVIRTILSCWVITTERVIDFQMTPLVKDDAAYITIRQIREIEKEKHGLLQNILNYGRLVIHVADAHEPFIINYIPHPSKFVNLIEAIREGKMAKEFDPEMVKDIYKRKYSAFLHK